MDAPYSWNHPSYVGAWVDGRRKAAVRDTRKTFVHANPEPYGQYCARRVKGANIHLIYFWGAAWFQSGHFGQLIS